MNKTYFEKLSPLSEFLYFFFVIINLIFTYNPILTFICFVSSFLLSVQTTSFKNTVKITALISVVIILGAIINPLFNHEGATVLTYFRNGNPLTLESIIFGICSGFLTGALLLSFSCFTKIFTSDKALYLVGNITPSVSMIFSMTLRFIPLFFKRAKDIFSARRYICPENQNASFIKKIRLLIKNLDILVTRCLEDSLTTALSMKAKGFGCTKRTFYAKYLFLKRDIAFSAFITLIGCLCAFFHFADTASTVFFPIFSIKLSGAYNITAYLCYSFLCFSPIILNTKEEVKWHFLKSKI